MSNVIMFPRHKIAPTAARRQKSANNVVALPVRKAVPAPFVLPREKELAALERALAELKAAMASGNLAGVREWRDELEVMEMHTDHFDIRGRCRLALKTA